MPAKIQHFPKHRQNFISPRRKKPHKKVETMHAPPLQNNIYKPIDYFAERTGRTLTPLLRLMDFTFHSAEVIMYAHAILESLSFKVLDQY